MTKAQQYRTQVAMQLGRALTPTERRLVDAGRRDGQYPGTIAEALKDRAARRWEAVKAALTLTPEA
jgi:hypothetical protein